MSQSHPHSFGYPTLLLSLGFLLAAAQAQFDFFPATTEACSELNSPGQGGIYSCSTSGSIQLLCFNVGGFPVNSGARGVPMNGQVGGIPEGVFQLLPIVESVQS